MKQQSVGGAFFNALAGIVGAAGSMAPRKSASGKKAGCSPCEAMAKVQAAKARAKSVYGGPPRK